MTGALFFFFPKVQKFVISRVPGSDRRLTERVDWLYLQKSCESGGGKMKQRWNRERQQD